MTVRWNDTSNIEKGVRDMAREIRSAPPDPHASRSALGIADLRGLFTEMRGELLRVLRRRTGDDELAADLTHDVFVKLSAVKAVIPDHSHGRAYLFRMAGNLAIDHGRTEQRRADILTGSQILFEDVQPGPEQMLVDRDQLRRVELALADLPERCREVLYLSQVQGMTHREIAESLDVSVSLIEKYRLRALRHCRTRLATSE